MKFKHKYEETPVVRELFKNHEFLFTYRNDPKFSDR